MKRLKKIAGVGTAVIGILCTTLLFTGCATNKPVAGTPTGTNVTAQVSDVFQFGDLVTITFSGASDVSIPAHQEAIKDDGSITPPFSELIGGSVTAAGKTPGQLQKELQEKYNKLYRNLTVTVNSSSRSYYISGEVRSPGPKPYPGETDVIKAISSAGDFTDFANKKRVQITRANGQKETVNYFKILADPSKDKPIYPGDKIYVPRRWF